MVAPQDKHSVPLFALLVVSVQLVLPKKTVTGHVALRPSPLPGMALVSRHLDIMLNAPGPEPTNRTQVLYGSGTQSEEIIGNLVGDTGQQCKAKGDMSGLSPHITIFDKLDAVCKLTRVRTRFLFHSARSS